MIHEVSYFVFHTDLCTLCTSGIRKYNMQLFVDLCKNTSRNDRVFVQVKQQTSFNMMFTGEIRFVHLYWSTLEQTESAEGNVRTSPQTDMLKAFFATSATVTHTTTHMKSQNITHWCCCYLAPATASEVLVLFCLYNNNDNNNNNNNNVTFVLVVVTVLQQCS